jgi:polyisoprenoid-binding protein YceI
MLPSRLRTKRAALSVLGAAVVAAVAVFAFVYFVLFPTSSPQRFAVATPEPGAASAPAATVAGAAGGWKIAKGSAAGYRVREKLAFLPAQSDAVGRTSAIAGQADIDASTVNSASFTVDVGKLTSDKPMRDQRIRSMGLESDRFPTATFVLAKPLKLPSGSGVGHARATGDLTLHGVKRRVTIPLTTRVSSSAIEAVGSITFPWSEFGMTAPSVAGFVSVTGKATMEFDLHLAPG